MRLNYLAFAVPLFTGLMLLEHYLSERRSKKVYHFREAVANLNVGIAERLADMFMAGVFYFFFSWIYRHFALFDIHPGVWTWIWLFFFTDLIWYWHHRAGHVVDHGKTYPRVEAEDHDTAGKARQG